MPHRTALEPANSIIQACGGTVVVAEFLRINRVTVWRWTQARGPKGGTNGEVPERYQPKIIAWAREHKKPISEQSFSLRPIADAEMVTLDRSRLRVRKLRRLAA